MSYAPKGSVLVSDGSGKINIISPTSNNQVLVLDSSLPEGAKFVDIKALLPNQKLRSSATSGNSTGLTTYTKITEVSVPGEASNPITSIKIVGYKENPVDSYDVRVINAANGDIIAEANFTNNIPAVNDMGALANLPQNESILEFLLRRNGGSGNNKNAYLSEANIDISQ